MKLSIAMRRPGASRPASGFNPRLSRSDNPDAANSGAARLLGHTKREIKVIKREKLYGVFLNASKESVGKCTFYPFYQKWIAH